MLLICDVLHYVAGGVGEKCGGVPKLISRVGGRVYQSSFPIFRNFLPNPGRILPALTFDGCDPSYVNAGRILP